MRHHHALRPPRRPRRIDHVRRMPRPARARRGRPPPPGLAGTARPGPGHRPPAPAPRPAPSSPRRRLGRRDHHRRGRVREHERDPLGRVARIDRQVRRPRLEHPQHRGHQLGRPAHHHRDHRLRPRPGRRQHPRQPRRPRYPAPGSDTAVSPQATATASGARAAAPRTAPAASRPGPPRPCHSTPPAPAPARPGPAPRTCRSGVAGVCSSAVTRPSSAVWSSAHTSVAGRPAPPAERSGRTRSRCRPPTPSAGSWSAPARPGTRSTPGGRPRPAAGPSLAVPVVEQRGEQGHLARQPAGLLGQRERGVLVGEQPGQLGPHRRHRPGHVTRTGVDPDRERVQEQALDLVRARPPRPSGRTAPCRRPRRPGPPAPPAPGEGEVEQRGRGHPGRPGLLPQPGREPVVDRRLACPASDPSWRTSSSPNGAVGSVTSPSSPAKYSSCSSRDIPSRAWATKSRNGTGTGSRSSRPASSSRDLAHDHGHPGVVQHQVMELHQGQPAAGPRLGRDEQPAAAAPGPGPSATRPRQPAAAAGPRRRSGSPR